ncbi:MAG: alpha-N-acetylglucosaminidase [Akkermansia sp.]
MAMLPSFSTLGFLSLTATSVALCAPAHLDPSPITIAQGVVERMTPDAQGLVSFDIDPSLDKKITISPTKTGIIIKAAHVRELIAGYGWYLKNVAKVHFSWNGDRLDLPTPLPRPDKTITITEPWNIVFAYNYCTLSYTAAFWDWDRWQHELDFLALSGFTHALVTAGLEKTWKDFLTNLGYPQDKIIKFIPNPAAAAWWNMGNLEGHGGPLSQGQINSEALLGKKIVSRMKQMGMTPVLQGYVGFIPSDFEATVPAVKDLKVIPQGEWVGFKRPAVIDPTCPAFPKFAEAWYKALHQVYGTTSTMYGGDLFHEGGTSGGINVTKAAQVVQSSMQKASPNSNWVIQAWGGNPSNALLLGIDKEHSLILNLTKNLTNHKGGLRTFNGIPWVWCELANFGGKTGMYGGLPLLSQLGSQLSEYQSQGLIGMGTLSEGLETNPLHYSLFSDRLWTTDDIPLDSWLKDYAIQRYGSAPDSIVEALKSLSTSIYSPVRDQEGCTESIICGRPSWDIRKASTWSSGEHYYELSDIIKAAQGYLDAANAHPELLKQATFHYDFVDIMRQVLADAAFYQLQATRDAYDMKDEKAFKENVRFFLSLITDMDDILGTDEQFLLGTWQTKALNKGQTPQEKESMDRAAKMMITTWIAKAPQALNDYSNRQWSGLVNDFYLPRWKNFFEAQLDILTKKKDQAKANKECAEKTNAGDLAFCDNKKRYPNKAEGNALTIANKIIKSKKLMLNKLAISMKQAKGIPWDLSKGNTLEFNVTDKIDAPGTYTASFKWQSGSSALAIHSVSLYEGNKKVAADTHEGWTGTENKENTYKIILKKYRTNLDAYTLKATVSGVSNPTDSRGELIFKKIQ